MSLLRWSDRSRLRLPGGLFLLAATLTLLAAWNTGVNLYYIILGALVSFPVVSFIGSRWSLRGLSVKREAPRAVHRGNTFPVTVRVRNHKRWLPAMSLRVERTKHPGQPEGYILSLPPQKEATFLAKMEFERRGVYRLPALEIASGFPFGLIEHRKSLTDNAEVVVYPRVRAVRPAAFEQVHSGGASPRRSKGEGDEFFSLRDYTPGDDLRRVSWRASARAGKLLVKQLARDTSRYVACVLDNRLDGTVTDFDELFEESVELAASLAVTLLQRHHSVSLITVDDYLPLGEGPSHVVKTLDMLARVKPVPPPAADPFLLATDQEEGRRLRFICVSPNPMLWGNATAAGNTRVLNPSEVLHA